MVFRLVALVILLWVSPAFAATVEFGWDPNKEPDLAGYRLYQSMQSGVYQYGSAKAVKDIPAGTETVTHVVTGDGVYFWVLTAYDTAGLESGPSNEVTAKIDTTPPAPPTGFWGRLVKIILGWFKGLTVKIV